ncbi:MULTISPECIES: thioredoxin [Spirulina sp. CCY15215]|uniref:thioredoxin n=1 Tax=Spirulina sp. CCY15215 TaxID=2767591 RepID=UPI0032AECFC5
MNLFYPRTNQNSVMEKATYIQESDFDSCIADNSLVVIDFTAPWCGPCRVIAPLIDKLAQEYENRATVVKIDIDTNKSIPKKFNVRSIPAVLFFKDAELVETFVGKATYEEYQEMLEKHLAD